jgi:carbonic anhydrase
LRGERLAALLCGVITISTSAVLPAQNLEHEEYKSPWRTPWTYDEAAHWSELDPQYATCNRGKEQSPIDIQNAQPAKLPPLTFKSKSSAVKRVINNRYTIRVNYRPGNGNFLIAGDKPYQLTQFHFHHPSEEQINRKAYPMEVHLMYQAEDGGVAGVTVFVQAGTANPTVQKLWEHMPRSEGQQEVSGLDMSPADLLPSEQVRSYYTYTGSVTAPPCTEGVTWFILKQAVEISAEQIDAFATLFPNDARPLQPLNGRVVRESQ